MLIQGIQLQILFYFNLLNSYSLITNIVTCRTIKYEYAMKDCAEKGSIVHPIKNKNVHDFLAALVPATIGFDIWIGLRNQKHIQIYDPDPELYHPLQETKIVQMTYSDHEMFDEENDYLYGERKLEGDCFFLKQQSKFKGTNK